MGEEPKERRRLAFLVAMRWRFPARERMTLPVPVILNRLATAFRVLIPLGRRIIITFSKRAGNIGIGRLGSKRYFREFSVQNSFKTGWTGFGPGWTGQFETRRT